MLLHDTILGGLTRTEVPTQARHLKVLDVACGFGLWATKFAIQYGPENFPNLELDVVGIDLAPLHPFEEDTRPWLSFESPVDITTGDWKVDPSSCDLIHLARGCGAVSDWQSFYYRVCG